VAWSAALALFALTATPAAALAQSTSGAAPSAPVVDEKDREAQRTRLYKQAVESANAGRWGEAAETLKDVLAIRSSAKVRFTLGQAEEQVGRLAAAYEAYAQALADGEAAGEEDVAAAAGRAMHTLAPRVPVVRVWVTGEASAGATATIDGRPAPPGQPVRVDPGAHRISVKAPGARPTESTIEVGEGQRVDVPVRLEAEGATVGSTSPSTSTAPATSAVEPAGPSLATKDRSWRAAGLVVLGTGAVGLVVGTYFGFEAISKNNASNRGGCTGDACTASGYATRENARSDATVSTVMFVAGGVLAASGVALWLMAPRREATAHVQAVRMMPLVSARGGGLTVVGAWR
jgi:hypothetical protein